MAAVRSADPARVDDALKTAGADINAVDKYGFTPLHLACKLQITEVAERLIDAPGIDLDAVTRRGFSAMMVATWKGEVKVVEKLLLAGAKFAVKDGGGRDAWALAHDWDHEEILELFERHGHVWGEQTRTKDPVGLAQVARRRGGGREVPEGAGAGEAGEADRVRCENRRAATVSESKTTIFLRPLSRRARRRPRRRRRRRRAALRAAR